MKTSTTITIIIVVLVLILGLGGAYYFISNQSNSTTYQNQGTANNPPPTQTVQPAQNEAGTIHSDSELMSASEGMDAANVDQIDATLNQNDNDAKAF